MWREIDIHGTFEFLVGIVYAYEVPSEGCRLSLCAGLHPDIIYRYGDYIEIGFFPPFFNDVIYGVEFLDTRLACDRPVRNDQRFSVDQRPDPDFLAPGIFYFHVRKRLPESVGCHTHDCKDHESFNKRFHCNKFKGVQFLPHLAGSPAGLPVERQISRTGLLFRGILPVIPDVFLKFFRRNDLEVTDFPVLFGSAE